MSVVHKLLNRVRKGYEKVAEAHVPVSREPEAPQHDDNDVPIGVHGVLAATEKLLAVNRGLAPTDERDSLQFKRVMDVHHHLKERVRLDADKVRLNVVRRASKTKNLNGIHAFVFDPYIQGQITGNSLSSPGEEINPMQNLEQSRRITQMGPGGLGSTQAISADASNIHPSQFGFISGLEGPECHDSETEVFTSEGWMPWSMVSEETKFACRLEGGMEFHIASRIVKAPYKGRMFGAKNRSLGFLVTPNHRMWTASAARTEKWAFESAAEHHKKYRCYHASASSFKGQPSPDYFELPKVECLTRGQNNTKKIPPIPMENWAEFMGWYLAEGSTYPGKPKGNNRYRVCISQSKSASPDHCKHLLKFLNTLPFGKWGYSSNSFHVKSKQLCSYLQQFGYRSQKFIPEYMQKLPLSSRLRMLCGLMNGDGHVKPNGMEIYSTSSPALAKGVERLLLGLGCVVSHTKWKAKYETGFTWMYSVSQLLSHTTSTSPDNHFKVDYDGMVYCATVPGGLLFTRRGNSRGFWSGNSEMAGIDSRVAMGTKLGSDGQLYQKFKDLRSGKMRWMSPADVSASVLKLPD
jgi:LAGLIDADG DNA endonuclease family protein/RNA polymerase Rpb2